MKDENIDKEKKGIKKDNKQFEVKLRNSNRKLIKQLKNDDTNKIYSKPKKYSFLRSFLDKIGIYKI